MKFKYKSNNIKIGFANDILENILKVRGIKNSNQFLNLTDSVIEDYNNYININFASDLLIEHINKESNISILVDYDLDGYTSGAEMYLEIQELCKILNKPFKVTTLIHSHKSHGLDKEIMDLLTQNDYRCNLLVIPDASSNDYEQHKILFNRGIDVLVLDHHGAEKYSEYACVVNNQLSDKVSNKSITGVGVVYKLCKCIDDKLNINIADNWLDLVALGLIADSADMRNLETRYITLKGLKLIESHKNKNKLITELYNKKSYSLKDKATINGFAFYMSPSINCIIRGGDYDTKVKLFEAFVNSDKKILTKIRGKGEVEISIQEYIVRQCDSLKRKQNKLVDAVVDDLSEQIEEYKLNQSEIMVINGENIQDTTYNRVIVNKLSSKYNKHAIILKSENDSMLGGSATGRKNKSITDLKQWCRDTKLFSLAEGHPLAFGVKIPKSNINNLFQVISQMPSEDVLTYQVDFIFNDKTLRKEIVGMIGGLSSIWGNKLDEPLFAIENIIINSSDITINESKTTIKFTYNDIEFIKFKTNEDVYNEIKINNINEFTIIGRFTLNEYNGTSKSQVVIEDFEYKKSNNKTKFRF